MTTETPAPPAAPPALSRRLVARNTAAILAARGIDVAAGLITLRLLAPYLGPAAFGDYAWVWAFVLALQPLVNFEMERVMIREGARDRGRVRALWGAALAVKGTLLVLFACVVVTGASWLDLSPQVRTALLFAGLSEVFYHVHMLHSGVFQGRERMDADLGLMVAFRVTLLAGIVLGVAWREPLPFFFAAAAAANLLRAGAGAAVVLRRLGPPQMSGVGAIVREMLGTAWPMTLGAILAGLTLNLDVLILKAFAPAEEVGYFQLAHPILLQLQIVPGALVTALFPGFSRTFQKAPAQLAGFLRDAAGVFFVAGGAGAILLWAVADLVAALLGAGRYGPAGPALGLMALALPALFAMTLYSFAIVAADSQRDLIFGSGAGLVTNGALALLLVPTMGAQGAAVATVGAYTMMGACYGALAVRRLPGAMTIRLLARMAGAAAVPLAVVLYAPLPRWATAGLALAAFLALSWDLAFGTLKRLAATRGGPALP